VIIPGQKYTRDYFRFHKIRNPKVCLISLLLYLPPICPGIERIY
jgi:hypothetical protein